MEGLLKLQFQALAPLSIVVLPLQFPFCLVDLSMLKKDSSILFVRIPIWQNVVVTVVFI